MWIVRGREAGGFLSYLGGGEEITNRALGRGAWGSVGMVAKGPRTPFGLEFPCQSASDLAFDYLQ